MKKCLLLLLLTSCFTGTIESPIAQGPSAKKQRQRIVVLQKKLKEAEQEQQKVQAEVDQLTAEIGEAQIALIRKQIDRYEKKVEKVPPLFLEEREALYRMIQTGPSPSAFEAQVELDRILRLITENSDETKHG